LGSGVTRELLANPRLRRWVIAYRSFFELSQRAVRIASWD
jgi:hypothetical protein